MPEFEETTEKGGLPPFSVSPVMPVLDARLASAASFVRSGVMICDVGTDHAYLPIFLVKSGIVPFANATDVNPSPLERARLNAEQYGCSGSISFFLSDGLNDVPLPGNAPCDIMICGMGGELIARILTAAPGTRRPGVRAILQPMSSAVDLRMILAHEGYNILDERLSESAGKLYTCMLIEWDGILRSPSPVEMLLGAANIKRGKTEPLFEPYLKREYASVLRRREGLRAGGKTTEEDDSLLLSICSVAEKEGFML